MRVTAATLFAICASASVSAAFAAPLELEATIPMPGVKGRIDHFAVDVAGHRLFVAALGNDSLEIIDTAVKLRLKSVPGFGEPQGIAYVPSANRLYIANGTANRVDVLDASSFAPVRRVDKLEDADNVRYDGAETVIVGYGGGALKLFRAATGEPGAEIALVGHPESFQLERQGPRVFVNVPTGEQVAVVDRVKGAVLARWPVPNARHNFPMALDETGRRLFVGARAPSLMLVYDIDTGQVVARVAIGGDTDDLFYDRERKRIYAVCGEGRIDVLRQEARDNYVHEALIKTAPRARTGLFVPEEGRLYVAAPAAGLIDARVLVYRVSK